MNANLRSQIGLRPGGKVDDYTLLGLRGAGATAEVWEVRGPNGEIYAMKFLLNPKGRGARRRLERFAQSAVILLRIRHRHLPQGYGSGQIANAHWQVMEFIDGPSLEEVLEVNKQGVGLARSLWYTEDVLSALCALHTEGEKGVIHRDIKPANCLQRTNPDGTKDIVIVDLGVAIDPEAVKRTQDRDFVGTLLYAPPEQIARPKSTDLPPVVDVYAAGKMLFQFFRGVVLAPPDYDDNLLEDAMFDGFPPGLRQLIRRMTNSEAHRRPTAAEALVMLRKLIRELELEGEIAELRGLPEASIEPVAPAPVPLAASDAPAASVLAGAPEEVENDLSGLDETVVDPEAEIRRLLTLAEIDNGAANPPTLDGFAMGRQARKAAAAKKLKDDAEKAATQSEVPAEAAAPPVEPEIPAPAGPPAEVVDPGEAERQRLGMEPGTDELAARREASNRTNEEEHAAQGHIPAEARLAAPAQISTPAHPPEREVGYGGDEVPFQPPSWIARNPLAAFGTLFVVALLACMGVLSLSGEDADDPPTKSSKGTADSLAAVVEKAAEEAVMTPPAPSATTNTPTNLSGLTPPAEATPTPTPAPEKPKAGIGKISVQKGSRRTTVKVSITGLENPTGIITASANVLPADGSSKLVSGEEIEANMDCTDTFCEGNFTLNMDEYGGNVRVKVTDGTDVYSTGKKIAAAQ